MDDEAFLSVSVSSGAIGEGDDLCFSDMVGLEARAAGVQAFAISSVRSGHHGGWSSCGTSGGGWRGGAPPVPGAIGAAAAWHGQCMAAASTAWAARGGQGGAGSRIG